MAIRFRKRIKVLPGVWLNLSKSGLSTTVGGKGVTVNVGKDGTRSTLNIPGTGVSYTHHSAPSEHPSLPLSQPQPEPARREGSLARSVAIILWIILIVVLASAMH
ncbi:MAG: DUF4236 domain-containing protein [Burkholderiales bacterium]|nr:DUF4236 domain-containing protein [Burkholderiales bacterium]